MCEISVESGSDFGESELSSCNRMPWANFHTLLFSLWCRNVLSTGGCNKSNLHLHIATGYFHFSCKPSQSTAEKTVLEVYKMTLGTDVVDDSWPKVFYQTGAKSGIFSAHTLLLTVLILKVKVACVYFVPLHCASSDGFLDGEKAGLFFSN